MPVKIRWSCEIMLISYLGLPNFMYIKVVAVRKLVVMDLGSRLAVRLAAITARPDLTCRFSLDALD